MELVESIAGRPTTDAFPVEERSPVGLERLAAGVIVIGLIVWGASVLATPDDALASQEPPAPRDEPTEDVDAPAPVDEEADDDRDEDDEPDRVERKRRGKGGGD